jgi:hypothetical protein
MRFTFNYLDFFFVNNYKDSDNVVTTIFVVYETHPSLCCLKAL